MDQISAKFLRNGAEVLAIFSRNINLSIKQSTFLEDSKIAKLKPVFKKDAAIGLFHFSR